MSTKSDKGGALLYVSKVLNYKVRSSFTNPYGKRTWINICWSFNQVQQKHNCRFIYKYPNMAAAEFSDSYLQPLLDKLTKWKKDVILMGDFNVDLLHYETHSQSRELLDKMFSALLSPPLQYQWESHPTQQNINW